MIKHTVDQLTTMLSKLASDDGFRDRLLGDPVRALGALGITLDPSKVPAARSLPGKDVAAADQVMLENTRASQAHMVPFLLSGISVSRLAA